MVLSPSNVWKTFGCIKCIWYIFWDGELQAFALDAQAKSFTPMYTLAAHA